MATRRRLARALPRLVKSRDFSLFHILRPSHLRACAVWRGRHHRLSPTSVPSFVARTPWFGRGDPVDRASTGPHLCTALGLRPASSSLGCSGLRSNQTSPSVLRSSSHNSRCIFRQGKTPRRR